MVWVTKHSRTFCIYSAPVTLWREKQKKMDGRMEGWRDGWMDGSSLAWGCLEELEKSSLLSEKLSWSCCQNNLISDKRITDSFLFPPQRSNKFRFWLIKTFKSSEMLTVWQNQWRKTLSPFHPVGYLSSDHYALQENSTVPGSFLIRNLSSQFHRPAAKYTHMLDLLPGGTEWRGRSTVGLNFM